MTFNEINNQMDTSHPLFLWTNSGLQIAPGENAREVMFQAGHHELLASAKAVKIGHEINLTSWIGAMIAVVPVYPYRAIPTTSWQRRSPCVATYFFADVQARGAYRLTRYGSSNGRLDHPADAEDAQILADGTVDYIGFSYYASTTVKADVSDLPERTDTLDGGLPTPSPTLLEGDRLGLAGGSHRPAIRAQHPSTTATDCRCSSSRTASAPSMRSRRTAPSTTRVGSTTCGRTSRRCGPRSTTMA